MEPVVVAPTPSASVMHRTALATVAAAAAAVAAAVVIVWHLCEKFFIIFFSTKLKQNGSHSTCEEFPINLF